MGIDAYPETRESLARPPEVYTIATNALCWAASHLILNDLDPAPKFSSVTEAWHIQW